MNIQDSDHRTAYSIALKMGRGADIMQLLQHTAHTPAVSVNNIIKTITSNGGSDSNSSSSTDDNIEPVLSSFTPPSGPPPPIPSATTVAASPADVEPVEYYVLVHSGFLLAEHSTGKVAVCTAR